MWKMSLAAVALAATAACTPGGDPSGSDGGIPGDAGTLEDAGTRGDAGPAGDADCPESFQPCGGDVIGTWDIVAFCPADGNISRPCENPFEGTAGCGTEASSAICTLDYRGTATFNADGTSVLETSAGMDVVYTLSADCAVAVGGGTDPAAACAAISTDRLACAFAGELCTCSASLEPESETISSTWSVEGTTLHMTETGVEPAEGRYCVDGDQMVVEGVIGWRYWVLARQ